MFFLFFSFSTAFAATVNKTDNVNKSDIQSLNYELKLIEERNRQAEEKTKIQSDALRNELLLRLEKLENRIDLYKWFVAIIFALLSFLGYKTISKWIKDKIEEKTEQELKKRITDEYVAKIVKEKGESAVNCLVKDLEREAKNIFNKLENTRADYESALQKIRTDVKPITDTQTAGEHKEDLRKFVENLVQAKTEEMYSFEDWMFKGYNDYTKNEFKSALRSWTKALQFFPNNPELYHNLGLAHARLKEYEQALKEFDMAISLKPDFQAAYVDKGTTFLRLGKIKEAIESYEQAKQFKGSILAGSGL